MCWIVTHLSSSPIPHRELTSRGFIRPEETAIGLAKPSLPSKRRMNQREWSRGCLTKRVHTMCSILYLLTLPAPCLASRHCSILESDDATAGWSSTPTTNLRLLDRLEAGFCQSEPINEYMRGLHVNVPQSRRNSPLGVVSVRCSPSRLTRVLGPSASNRAAREELKAGPRDLARGFTITYVSLCYVNQPWDGTVS
jgi:hypothetical protein